MPNERRKRAESPATGESNRPAGGGSFPIVGLGASAGGLEAFTELLENLPLDTGMGFVVVQHLDPQHESALTGLLTRATSLPVHEVTDNLPVQPNQVHVIPPNASLTLADGVLKLEPRERTRAPHHSIDSFFESLAQDQRECAIGVVLSGTATDGTLGLEAIKAEGGITFAQDDSARYDSMPRSAVAAGCVDFVLSPKNIARELARIAQHPCAGGRALEPLTASEGESNAASATGNGFLKILGLLRNHSGVDFSFYKPSTVQRRITRRMVLKRCDTPERYAQVLRGDAAELDALYADTLINVTRFFRNPEAFAVVERRVLPKLLKRGDGPLRAWVIGCSTGQEAYSVAMAFLEAAEKAPRLRKLQVFATDLNDAPLEKARHGLYAKSIAQEVTPERLRRFFVEEEGGYRVVKPLREMVVFAKHNLIADPPFSRIDFISCRNLLIYLEASVQKKLLPLFHYALEPDGFLMLGVSESIGAFGDLFQAVDKKQRIYSRRAAPTPTFHLPVRARSERPSGRLRKAATRPGTGAEAEAAPAGFRTELDAQREADRVTIHQFAPPAVLINAELQILQFRGATSAYLEPPTGKASFDVLKMARKGLMLPLRAAISEAKKHNRTARRENVRAEQDADSRTLNLEVIPLKNLRERCFLVVFREVEDAGHARPAPATRGGRRAARAQPRVSARRSSRGDPERRVTELEAELAETRDYLQSMQEQQEASQEELQASNEEVQSANEELQSINEELETSKEELESTNEELTTVNEEMAHRNTELLRLNNDLVNVQTSAHLAIVLLGRDLTIRRFSAEAERQLNLRAADVGRPFSSIRHELAPSALESFLTEVIDTVRPREREMQDSGGRWFSLRVQPYLTLDNKVDGAVLVLVDIDELKRSKLAVEAARDYAENTIETVREALLVLDGELRVERANRSFYRTFRVTPAETVGRFIYELGDHEWDIPRLRQLLEEILPQSRTLEGFLVEHDFQQLGPRSMLLNARRMDDAQQQTQRILLAIEDVTESRRDDEARARLVALVESSDDPIITKTLEGIITSWNDAAERIFGYSAAEAVGRPISLITPPEHRIEQEGVLACIRRGERVDHFETERVARDGRRLNVSLAISPLKDASGRIIGVSKVMRDVTERLRAEAERKDLTERLAAELEATRRLQEISSRLIQEGDVAALHQQILAAAAAIMDSDMASMQTLDEGRNALRLLAWRGFGEEFAQTFEWVHPETYTSCSVAWRSGQRVVVPDVETCDFIVGTPELEDHLRSGIRAVQSTPLVSRDGRLLGMISTHWSQPHEPPERGLRLLDVLARQAADVIERAEAEDLRKDADRHKDEFLAMLAHELRNPLAPIRNALAVLRATGATSDPVQWASKMMERQVSQIVRLVDDLLDVSRISLGRIELRRERVELSSAVDGAVEAARPSCEARDQELTVALHPQPLYVNADPARLTQIVGNLLNNASKFTRSGGHVRLIAEEARASDDGSPGEVLIRVCDDGIGLETDQFSRIFEMFTQVDSSVERSGGGLGIGLALVRKLVEMHGGTVEVHSDGVGRGSEFVVRLPLSMEAADPSPEPKVSISPPTTKRRRILIVDDNRDAVESLSLLLERAGNETRTAYDGLAGVEAASAFRPDVVLLDLGMPRLNGYEAARMIREQPWGKELKLVAITGLGRRADRRRSKDAGFDAHMIKPVDTTALAKLLGELSGDER